MISKKFILLIVIILIILIFAVLYFGAKENFIPAIGVFPNDIKQLEEYINTCVKLIHLVNTTGSLGQLNNYLDVKNSIDYNAKHKTVLKYELSNTKVSDFLIRQWKFVLKTANDPSYIQPLVSREAVQRIPSLINRCIEIKHSVDDAFIKKIKELNPNDTSKINSIRRKNLFIKREI